MPSLPYELLQHIFRHLSSSDISSCALACRSWVAPAREHLLHTFRVPLSESRLDALQDILQSPHCTLHLARVHEIELFGWPRLAVIRFFKLFGGIGSTGAGEVGWTDRIHRWFNSEVRPAPNPNYTQLFLGNLNTLSISSLSFPNSVGKHPNSVLPLKSYTTLITSPFRLVRTLRLESVVFASPGQLHEFLVSFVELDVLVCAGVTLSSPSFSRVVSSETLRLRDLHVDVRSIRALRGASLDFPNLRNLALNDGNRDKLTDAGVFDVFSEFIVLVNARVQSLSLDIASTDQFAKLPPNHPLDLSTSFPHLTHLSLAVPQDIVSFLLEQVTRPHRTLWHVILHPPQYGHRCFHPDKPRYQQMMREADALLQSKVLRLKVLKVVPMVSNSEEERETILLGYPRCAEMGMLEVVNV